MEISVHRVGRPFWILFLFGLLFPLISAGQCPVTNTAFSDHEDAEYDLYFEWGILWKRIGVARFQTHSSLYQGKDCYRISLQAETSSFMDNIFMLRDTLTSYVTRDLVPLYFSKAALEMKRYSVDQTWYSHEDGVSRVRQERRRPSMEPLRTEGRDSRCIYDMMSLIVRARNDDFSFRNPGDETRIPLATGRRVDEVTLIYEGEKNVRGRDEGRTSYRCRTYRVKILTEHETRARDIMTFYVTDDVNRLPVSIDLNLNFGSAKVYLRSVKGLNHPFGCILRSDE